jgi:hypothetical protein
MTDDDPMPWDLQEAFRWALAEYNSWRRHGGPEPTMSFDGNAAPISLICGYMTPYERTPLKPRIMNHLLAVADDRHSNLKSQLADNYASAGRYLLALIEYRKSQLRERNAQT